VYILAVFAAIASLVSVMSAAPAPGASKHQQAIAEPPPVYKPVPVHKPPRVYVGAKGAYVRAAQGSYCYGICAFIASPLQFTARLPVLGHQRLTVDAGKRLEKLRANLMRLDGEHMISMGAARARPTGQGRFWRVRLPADVAGADALSLDLSYGAEGTSNVWAGLAG
jgi:hypothetical protein